MCKYIIIFVLLSFLFLGVRAQDRDSIKKVNDKFLFFKSRNENIKIKHKDALFYDYRRDKKVNQTEMSKDSLRKFLVGNGFYDYDFECYHLVLKDINELNESYIRTHQPDLYTKISDKSYNKITYSFEKEESGVSINILVSKNYVEFDDVKEGRVVVGADYLINETTYSGTSYKGEIYSLEAKKYEDVLRKKNVTKKSIKLQKDNRFKITIDISSHSEKYVSIEDINGNILSVVKIY